MELNEQRFIFVYHQIGSNAISFMNKRPIVYTFFTLIFVFGLTSCSTILSRLYGVRDIKTIDEKTIVHYSKKYNIPLDDNYELDTSYFSFLKSIDTTQYKSQCKNHYQPLQSLYYDNRGNLRSFQISCYAGGFPNLLWNRDGILSVFPPLIQAPIDSIVSFETQLKYLRPLSQTKKFSADSCDFVVIVFWSRFMGRQSKRLIRFVQENLKLAGAKKVKIIYVNNDNFFAALN